MADLEELQRRFNRYKIISQPEPGQPEYRIEMRLALVRATKGFLDDMKAAKS